MQVVESSVRPGERRIEAPLGANERLGALVEPDPAATGELDRAREDGAGPMDDLARRDSRGQAKLPRCQHSAYRVVVRDPSAPKTATSLPGRTAGVRRRTIEGGEPR